MKTVAKYLTFLALSVSFLYADETRIEPGTRKLTSEDQKTYESQKKDEYAQVKQSKKNNLEYYDNYLPPLYFTHGAHNVIAISALGDSLMIEDGSEWKIRPGYAKEALTWRESDPLLVLENDSWLSSWIFGYQYKLYNGNTHTYIEVKLHLGPVLANPNTLQVFDIDYYNHEVRLSDNSCWKFDPAKCYLVQKWLIGDGVIIGTNTKTSFFGKPYENMLINVNMLHNVNANQVE